MRTEALPFPGAYKLHGARTPDRRGAFSRLVDLGDLPGDVPQLTTGYLATAHNRFTGTLRGLHFQAPPNGESKLVWCTSGSVFDVLVDMRRDQPTYGSWLAERLSPEDPASLLVPPGVAHGYQTLTDDTTVSYLICGEFRPESARTLAWDDPTVAIDWPLSITEISERDRNGVPWPVS